MPNEPVTDPGLYEAQQLAAQKSADKERQIVRLKEALGKIVRAASIEEARKIARDALTDPAALTKGFQGLGRTRE